jgi:hypothetical protein
LLRPGGMRNTVYSDYPGTMRLPEAEGRLAASPVCLSCLLLPTNLISADSTLSAAAACQGAGLWSRCSMGVVTEVLASTPMALVMGASTPATGEALGIERFGLYLAADDLDRSTAFHEALFGEEPQVRNEGPVGSEVTSGFFALVSQKAYRLTMPPGGSVRRYAKASDIDVAYGRVKRLAPDRFDSNAVADEGAFHVFRFSDPEGHVVEFLARVEALGHAGGNRARPLSEARTTKPERLDVAVPALCARLPACCSNWKDALARSGPDGEAAAHPRRLR